MFKGVNIIEFSEKLANDETCYGYLDEFNYRFNRLKHPDTIFHNLVCRMMVHPFMQNWKKYSLSTVFLVGFTLFSVSSSAQLPKTYRANKVQYSPLIDGKGNDKAWQQAEWTDGFVDIVGDESKNPYLTTRCKMLWNGHNLYIYAELDEPHVWATLKQRDTVIFYDNDFEIFIDPDGDSHNYYELEVNALGTVWDLKLNKPYRKGGRPNSAWNVKGLQFGVHVDGSLNQPGDKDKGWSIEILIPWKAFDEFRSGKKHPDVDEQKFRINFSRVQWETDIKNGKYVKTLNPKTGKALSEHNWTWSPQGVINMHIPSKWGYLILLN